MNNSFISLALLIIFSFYCNTTFANNSKPLFEISSAPNTKASAKIDQTNITFLKINQEMREALYQGNETTIQIEIPQLSKAPLQVTLFKKQILGDHFYVSTMNGPIIKQLFITYFG